MSKHISCLILFAVVFHAAAQDIPELPRDPAITIGTLPNGVSWYLVSNPEEKGSAGAALIQKGPVNKAKARKSLSELPHFTDGKPGDFLVRHGVMRGKQGYVSYGKDFTRFDFENIPVYSQSVTDSTLLLLFDLMAAHPFDQALVISGDINASAIKDRLGILSLMVNPLTRLDNTDDYSWVPAAEPSFSSSVNATSDLAVLSLDYRTPKLGRDRIATVQPLVTEVFSRELAIIIRKRLSTAFRNAGIPLAGVSYNHLDSADGEGDEHFSLEVYTSSRRSDEATVLVASVLSELDREGASLEEFQNARDQVESEALRNADVIHTSNRMYVNRCVANYLRGASLASISARNAFFSSRRLEAERELQFFNDFQSALIDSAANLSVNCDVALDPPSTDSLSARFLRGWNSPTEGNLSQRIAYSDTLGLFIPPAKPTVKIRHEAAEPVSGGTLWTLSNGLRVIYKKTAIKGEFEYALMVRGGFTEIAGLEPGESAFVGDMLDRSRVAGMSGDDFHNMLSTNGITMNTSVSVSDMRVRGSAPSGKLKLVLSSLLSLANDREPETENFDYYRDCQAIGAELAALSTDGINEILDSLICPEYTYPLHRSVAGLGGNLPEKAEKYFEKQFARTNDGVIVFAGDLNVDDLKRQMCLYFGDLRTTKKTVTRPRVNFPMTAGGDTYTSKAEECPIGDGVPGINVEMCARIPFSRENYFAFKLACAALETYFTRELAGAGQYFQISAVPETTPVERMTLFMNFRNCNVDGLPVGTGSESPLSALPAVRKAVENIKDLTITDSELSAYKARISARMAAGLDVAENVINAVLLRYSDSKDLVTDYKRIIDSLTVADVKEILRQLDEGSRIEYIIL